MLELRLSGFRGDHEIFVENILLHRSAHSVLEQKGKKALQVDRSEIKSQLHPLEGTSPYTRCWIDFLHLYKGALPFIWFIMNGIRTRHPKIYHSGTGLYRAEGS